MSRMSYEDLVQENESQKMARYITAQQKHKLREELEKELKKYKGHVTVLPGVMHKPRQPSPVRDTSNDYCGNLKAFRARQWIAGPGYNNGRRQRLAEVTDISLRRINDIACDQSGCILTNVEYVQIKAAMPKIEAMETEVAMSQQVAS